MISKPNKEELLTIYGYGFQIRNWLHVDDHCRRILAIILKGRVSEIII